MLMGPVWALAIMGAEIAPAATAAVFRRPRRRGLAWSVIESLLVEKRNLTRIFDD
jgi:hypothetical protein